MKYGIVTRHEWDENDAYPDESFCIVFLTNTGEVAPDELVENLSGVTMGTGNVWIFRDSFIVWLGNCALPTDIEFTGAFQTEPEAVRYYLEHYTNATLELERDMQAQVDVNAGIDELWFDRRDKRTTHRYYAIIAVCAVLIIIVILLARLLVLMGYK